MGPDGVCGKQPPSTEAPIAQPTKPKGSVNIPVAASDGFIQTLIGQSSSVTTKEDVIIIKCGAFLNE